MISKAERMRRKDCGTRADKHGRVTWRRGGKSHRHVTGPQSGHRRRCMSDSQPAYGLRGRIWEPNYHCSDLSAGSEWPVYRAQAAARKPLLQPAAVLNVIAGELFLSRANFCITAVDFFCRSYQL